jgi:drug/metabolite transporter (DMT)-like permease
VSLLIGLPLVGISAVLLNASFYAQHSASASLPDLSLARPFASLRLLVSDRAWLVASGAGWIGWGAYIAALGFAPLSIVQALSASGVGLLALIEHRFGAPLGRRELLGAALSVGGLVLVVSSLTHTTVGRRPGEIGLLVLVGCGLAVAAAAVAAPTRFLPRGAALGIAAGVCYGIGDVATKGALRGSGPVLIPVFLACNVLGFVTLQLAYQKGTVLETAGLASLFTNAIPIVIGISIFDESPPSGPLGAIRFAGFALTLVGGLLLARPPAAAAEG